MSCHQCRKMELKKDNDDLFEHHTFERDGYECQRCHDIKAGFNLVRVFDQLNVRWEPDNSVTLCFYCRAWGRLNPPEFAEFIQKRLGMGSLNELGFKAIQPFNDTGKNVQRINDKLQKPFLKYSLKKGK